MSIRSWVSLAAALVLVPTVALADVLEAILERGAVRIGVAEFVPWTFESANGELAGFEIDVGAKLAADIGVLPEYRLYPWEEIVPALQAGEIDVIAAGMAITPGRALEVAFSNPYFASGVGLATNTARTADVTSLTALNEPGRTIVTVAQTLAFDVAERTFDAAELQVLATPELAEAELLAGRADAYVASVPEVRFLALRHPDTVDVPIAEPLVGSKAGLAVERGEQAWLNFLNAWIVARDADHWLASAHAYWFESLAWRELVKAP